MTPFEATPPPLYKNPPPPPWGPDSEDFITTPKEIFTIPMGKKKILKSGGMVEGGYRTTLGDEKLGEWWKN